MWAIGLVVGAFIGGAYDGAAGVLGAVAGLGRGHPGRIVEKAAACIASATWRRASKG